jgi:hypothetical protein
MAMGSLAQSRKRVGLHEPRSNRKNRRFHVGRTPCCEKFFLTGFATYSRMAKNIRKIMLPVLQDKSGMHRVIDTVPRIKFLKFKRNPAAI